VSHMTRLVCCVLNRSLTPLSSTPYGHHRDLHSFPTRRSSDLRDDERRARRGAQHHRGLSARSRRLSRLPRRARRAADDGGPRARSEEHTSELQSREKLVCRLLLEKKKKK